MEPISPQPGSAQDPRHFVGRVRTSSTADRKLRSGANLLLNDPRRMGKSYWLKAYTSRTSDFVAVIIDYEGIPYLLHKVASLLDDGSGSPVTGVDVDEAFEEFIDDPDEFQSFAHLLTRLEPNYGADAKLARQILNEALSSENAWCEVEGLRLGLDQPERFDEVLADLVSDHYLTQRGRRVRWRYPALQYIWARRAMIWDRP